MKALFLRDLKLSIRSGGGALIGVLFFLTVVAGNIYDAARFATAAFALGRGGIGFIEQAPGLEGYAIDGRGVATMTSGFERLVVQ